MSELSFLLDLLLNHKLPKATRELITARVSDVEKTLTHMVPTAPRPMHPFPTMPNVPASAMAILERNPDLIPVSAAPQPVVVAQTPAAVAAMNSRQESINLAMSGKPAKGETRPRKF